MKRIFIILFTAIGLATGASAQNIAPRAEARLDSAKLLMGNLLRMQVKVIASSDSSRIEFPLLEQLHGKRYVGLVNDTIEVINPFTIDTIKGNQGVEFNYKFYIQAFDSGNYVLPPFQIKVDGQPIETNAMNLEVLPVKVKADDKIDDFSDTVDPFELVPEDALENEHSSKSWIIWLILGCVALIILLVYLFMRYRKTGSLLIRKPMAPYQIALKQLDKLQSQKLWEKGKVKTYYTRLFDIIRRYLNRQYGIKTLERTTSEILADVADNPELEMFTPSLERIFAAANFVKFAKVNPAGEENEAVMRDTRQFILESRPIEKDGIKHTEKVSHNQGDLRDKTAAGDEKTEKGGEK